MYLHELIHNLLHAYFILRIRNEEVIRHCPFACTFDTLIDKSCIHVLQTKERYIHHVFHTKTMKKRNYIRTFLHTKGIVLLQSLPSSGVAFLLGSIY